MSDPVRYHKVHDTLPLTLEPDSVYLVKKGEVYQQFITDSSTTPIAIPIEHRGDVIETIREIDGVYPVPQPHTTYIRYIGRSEPPSPPEGVYSEWEQPEL